MSCFIDIALLEAIGQLVDIITQKFQAVDFMGIFQIQPDGFQRCDMIDFFAPLQQAMRFAYGLDDFW